MANWEERLALGLGITAMLWKNIRPGRDGQGRSHVPPSQPGISVVIPSREGRHLLERMLPGVKSDLSNGEIIIVDNGSSDGTAEFLQRSHPQVRVDVHAAPLSFARAANRGAELARYDRLCLLNNDMEVEPGFFSALDTAFQQDPALFGASAQIFFPEGVRREETGKTAMRRAETLTPDDYPVFCDLPAPGESFSPVLYGSGGCSLYDRRKFLELSGFDEFYEPAYVEDLDLGYRAWLHGWPSVYVAGARVLHRHRATSSRFYTTEQLSSFLEMNHVRFLLRAMQSLEVFVPYYRHAVARVRSRAPELWPQITHPGQVFAAASKPGLSRARGEREILDLTGGAVRVFPGQRPCPDPDSGRKVLVSAGSTKPPEGWLEKLAEGAEIYYTAYCKPRAAPEPKLLELCRAVIFVDGPAGEGPYRSALNEARRRYSIQETIPLEARFE